MEGFFAHKKAVVVGLGKSGVSSAKLLASLGADVVAVDARPRADVDENAKAVEAVGGRVVCGPHSDELFLTADYVLLSPGVPPFAALDLAISRGAVVEGEIDLALRFLKGRVVGITGTNGKSTVTTLVGRMVESLGVPTFTGGNLGTPLVEAVLTDAAREDAVVVVELSSFQLERTTARIHVAALLNITDDHLDRHGTLAEYAAAKARIFHGQTRDDFAVIPSNDAFLSAIARPYSGALLRFGGSDGVVKSDGEFIVDSESGFRFPIKSLKIRGAHNVENACAAALLARLAGVSPKAIAEVLEGFGGLPHRMQFVRELRGVTYYDDSKATNVGASVAALREFDESSRVVLIAGGVDKGGSYAPLAESMNRCGRALVTLGAAAPLIEEAFAAIDLPVERATDIDDAVVRASRLASRGDSVVLAPACASFDMFRSYAHRGDEFQRAVRALREGE